MPDYELAARRAAKKYGVDPDIFVAQIRQESGLKPGLTSSAGAQGIAQFIPSTAKQYGVNLSDGRVSDDLDGAARYMRDNLDRTGEDYKAALSIYNSGRPDAYKDPNFAQGQTYNYVNGILKAAKVKAPKSSSAPSTTKTTQTVETPGVDNAPLRKQLVRDFLGAGGVKNQSAVLGLAGQYGQANDVAPTYSTQSSTSTKVKDAVPLGGPKNAGKGAFEISGPNPDRLQSGLTSFAERVAAIYGGKLVGSDGSGHSKYTTSGNVSEHFSGNATDIFEIGGKPAQGKVLLRAGRAALIAAGMPRKQALKAKGGLYNVGNHQIIFLTNVGGNHFDHLHISTHGSSHSAAPAAHATSVSADYGPVAAHPVAHPAPQVVSTPQAQAGPVKERLFAHPLRPNAQHAGGDNQVRVRGKPTRPPKRKPRQAPSDRYSGGHI